jgi:hypothetical protein
MGSDQPARLNPNPTRGIRPEPAGTRALTDEQREAIEARRHAAAFPGGCRGSWLTMCDDCCARIGAKLAGAR